MSNFLIFYMQRVGSTHLAHFLKQVDGMDILTRGDFDDPHHYEPLHKVKDRVGGLREFFDKDDGIIRGCKIPLKHVRIKMINFVNTDDIKVIFLNRKSTQDHLLSMIYARESKIWHNFDGNTIPEKITVTDANIDRTIRNYKTTQQKYEDLKGRFSKKRWLSINYEDAVTTEGKKEILHFLGKEWKKSYSNIDNEKKLLSEDHSNYFTNYDYLLSRISKIKG